MRVHTEPSLSSSSKRAGESAGTGKQGEGLESEYQEDMCSSPRAAPTALVTPDWFMLRKMSFGLNTHVTVFCDCFLRALVYAIVLYASTIPECHSNMDCAVLYV